MKEDDNMFTRIIEISYVEQNAAAVAIYFFKRCPLILGLLCLLFSWGNMDISSRKWVQGWDFTSQRLWNSPRSLAKNIYYGRKGLACDVSPRLTRAIMVGKTSLVRVCACLIDCQRTCELMRIFFSFLSRANYHRTFFLNAYNHESWEAKPAFCLSTAVTADFEM